MTMNRSLGNAGVSHHVSSSVRDRILSSYHCLASTSGRCCQPHPPAPFRDQCRRNGLSFCCAAAKGSRSSGSQGFKGFGEPPKPAQKQQRALTFEQDSEDEAEVGPAAAAAAQANDDDEGIELKPAYQMYTDAGYKAQRFVGPVSLQRPEGGPTAAMCTSAPVLPGDLLLVSPALGFVPGGFQEVPELEDLHATMLEDGPTPAQRRVLDILESLRPAPSPSPPAAAAAAASPAASPRPTAQAPQSPLPSLATLDVKFWSGRGRDTSAPQFSSQRLMRLLSRVATSDYSQDPAAMQARHQKPCGYVALWPESALLGHSCAPNTSQLVVADRLLLHAVDEMPTGTPLTRNMIGPAVTAPLAQRQTAVAEALRDMGLLPLPPAPEGAEDGAESGEALLTACRCPRCRLEASVSQELRDTLDAAHQWFVTEASETWAAANETEDVAILRGLLGDCEAILSEVEDAVQGEPGLDDEQQDWMRTAVYDVYDLLVTLDELVNPQASDADHLRTCLELIRVHSPGSDSHMMVALKHESLRQARLNAFTEMLKRDRRPAKGGGVSKRDRRNLAQLKQETDLAAELRIEAIILRYGYVTEAILAQLTEGLEAYVDGLEQLSVMQAQGVTELSREIEVEGVKVQIVDKLEVSDEARVAPGGRGAGGGLGAGAAGGATRVLSQDGMQVMWVNDAAPAGAAAAAIAAGAAGGAAVWGAASDAEDGAGDGGEEEEEEDGMLDEEGLELEGLDDLDLDGLDLNAELQEALLSALADAEDGDEEAEEEGGEVIDVEVEQKR